DLLTHQRGWRRQRRARHDRGGLVERCAVVHPADPRHDHGGHAHRTGLARGVELGARQVGGLQVAAGVADRLHLAVRGWIEVLRGLVQPFAHDLAVLHHDRAVRPRTRLVERLRRKLDRAAHEFFVVHVFSKRGSSLPESVPCWRQQRKGEGAMRPFEGIRVIDVTHGLAGPFAAYQLAVLGADVIKVDDPNDPDQSRSSGTDKALNYAQMGTGFLTQASNKRAITLDLKTERGREILKKLVATADVFVENYRPGAFEALGLGYEDLAKINPRLIYASFSAFGQKGPR